jgi:hypothetical protein
MSIYLGPDQWSLNNFMVSQIAVFGDRNGLADRVVSASSVPPPWGGQSSSPKGLTLYLWLRPQQPRGKKLHHLPHIQSTGS